MVGACRILRVRDLREAKPWEDECMGEGVVFYGEVHAREWSVRCELEVLRGYARAGSIRWVGLEMFEYNMQSLLDSWSRGEISWDQLLEEYERLGGGFPLDVYRPLLIGARETGLALKAIMLPRHIARIVSREGLGSEKLGNLDIPVDPRRVSVDYRWYRENFMELIPRHGPMARLDPERLLQAQALKDEVAAELSWRYLREQGPGLVVMGWAHVEYNGGVPTRLAERGGRYLVITSRETLDEAMRVSSRRGVIASFIAVGASSLNS